MTTFYLKSNFHSYIVLSIINLSTIKLGIKLQIPDPESVMSFQVLDDNGSSQLICKLELQWLFWRKIDWFAFSMMWIESCLKFFIEKSILKLCCNTFSMHRYFERVIKGLLTQLKPRISISNIILFACLLLFCICDWLTGW